MKKDHIVIGVSGLAGSGKDTFYQILSKKIEIQRYALADELKKAIRDELINDYNVDILTCSRQEKEIVRPRLVEFAKKVRFESQGRHWVNLLESKILPLRENVCITDVRYDDYEKDEIFWLKEEMGGILVHISQYEEAGNIKFFAKPPNEEEARNDPNIKAKADYVIEWPKVEELDEANMYAILDVYVENFLGWLNANIKTQR